MTREEFLAKKNRFEIPGWTDEEVDEELEGYGLSPENEEKSPAKVCACCGNLMMAGEICLMCGMDDWQGTCRLERILYKKRLEAHPEYIWWVEEENETGSMESEPELSEEEIIDLQAILTEVYEGISIPFSKAELERLEDGIEDADPFGEREILYRKDIVELLERVKALAGTDMEFARRALQSFEENIAFFKENKEADKQEYARFLASLNDGPGKGGL